MNFRFGCAKSLYQRCVHPRMMLGPVDLERLRAKMRGGIGGRILRVLRADTVRMADHILGSGDVVELLAQWQDWWGITCRVVTGLDDMALVAVLDDDERILEATRRVLMALPAADARGNRNLWHCGALLHVPLAYDLIAAHMTADERQTFTRWTVERCIRAVLQRLSPSFYKRAGMNAVLGETTAALLAILAVMGDEGIPSLEIELKTSLSFLEATLHTALGSEGYPEEDIGYGTCFLGDHIAPAVEAARRAGLYDAYRECPRYAKSGRAILHFVQPWGGYLSNTGDHSDGFLGRNFVLPRLATETRDPTLVWLAGQLKDQFYQLVTEAKIAADHHLPAEAMTLLVLDELDGWAHPLRRRLPTRFCDRRRGIVSFRSGWERDASLLVFDGSQRSPGAQGHFHASAGHFSFSALGEYFAIDTGRYCIEQDQHNVVLVDGKSGRSTDGEWIQAAHVGLLTDYLPGEFVDFAAADSSCQSDCYWARRSIGLVKGRGAPAYVWMVEDVNKDNDWHECWWCLNTAPGNRIVTRARGASVRGHRHGNWLDVHIALPAPEEYQKPHAVQFARDTAICSSTRYVKDPLRYAREHFDSPTEMVHRSALHRPRLIAKVSGYNGRFMSVMIPRRKTEQPVKVERLPSLDNSLAVRITFPTVEDTIIFAYEHNLLEAGNIKGRGQWCVVRRSRKTGKVLAQMLGNGTRMSIQ